ncbi:HNH endonuclease [Thalassospira aquimaris]|uniref:HNH endonuclease n=1 Tax=Thalassospira aquimaris TaxID=3037796 RepID=UPI0034601FCF
MALVRPSPDRCACGNIKSQVAKTCLDCRRKRVDATCKFCGGRFLHKPSRPRSACSAGCARQLRARGSSDKQSRKVDTVCQHCGKAKRVSPVYANRRFCSPRCAYDANSGPANAQWKGGVTSAHQRFFSSMDWKRACQRVWARDRRTCQRCGDVHDRSKRQHEVHHIAVWAKHPELRLDAKNLILLCYGCHKFVHSKRNTSGELIRR